MIGFFKTGSLRGSGDVRRRKESAGFNSSLNGSASLCTSCIFLCVFVRKIFQPFKYLHISLRCIPQQPKIPGCICLSCCSWLKRLFHKLHKNPISGLTSNALPEEREYEISISVNSSTIFFLCQDPLSSAEGLGVRSYFYTFQRISITNHSNLLILASA